MAGLIGKQLGRYQILEQLGAGGMATVFKAYDTRLEREVAIKVIRREAFPPDEMDMLLKRFERESKSLGRLSHPNIVSVIDYGEYEGSPYLVMEYLPGGTLKDRLGKPIPWQDAVRLILPVAQALEYVHERNIINRDVKPSNILLTEDGQPMLTDFGLVKIFGEQGKESTHLTSSGTGLGTPDYMAPEQWTGEATPQSDLYSLGVVFYEMITGHRPYTADTPAGVMLKQATESLPLPKSYIPNLPQDVESVLLRALAREAIHRYPDMHAFVSELQNLLAGKGVTASTIKTERLREQMTGKVERTTPRPAIHTARKRGSSIIPFLVVAALGMFLLVAVVVVGIWVLNANPGLLTSGGVPTQQVQVNLSPAILPTTEMVKPVVLEPTTTDLPVEPTLLPEIKDSKNVNMVLIPAGEFTMGSDTSGNAEARPGHTVYVDAFYIDKYEVTNEMYGACVYAVECRRPEQSGSPTHSTYFSNPVFANYPVIYIDWKRAKEYCKWRGARLPTEAEWEKAARGEDERIYPWGNESLDCSYANLTNCVGDTAPVDQYKKGQSPYGVYGMAGNVLEWTSSLFKLYPYQFDDGREDSGAVGKRVVRGGSWHTFGGNSGNARTDTRLELDPAYYGPYVGVRCAVSADQVAEP